MYPKSVKRHQVLLIQLQPLLGEGLQHIFMEQEDVDLVCLTYPDLEKIDDWLHHLQADMVLLAGEKKDERATRLILDMLQQYQDIPIVWIDLETNILQLYTSRSLTATSAGLLNAIRENSAKRMRKRPPEEQDKFERRR